MKKVVKKSRHIALLLYPDNEKHLDILARIKEEHPEYIGIMHHGDDDIKEHFHIYLCFPNPVFASSVSQTLDLEENLCRPLFGQFRDSLVYLVHRNAPEKEQYNVSDCFGSPALLHKLERYVMRYERSEVDTAEAVEGCIDWICKQQSYISYTAFVRWVLSTAFFKGASSPLVRMCLEEHNALWRETGMSEGRL